MEYVESNAYFMAFTDNEIVFALYILVFSPLQQPCSLLKGQYRTGIPRWDTRSGCSSVSVIDISF